MPREVEPIKIQDIVPSSTTETVDPATGLTSYYDVDLGFCVIRQTIERDVNDRISARAVALIG